MKPFLSQVLSPSDRWSEDKRFIFLFAMTGLFFPLISLIFGFNLGDPLFLIICPGALMILPLSILPIHGAMAAVTMFVVVCVSNIIIYAIVGSLSWKLYIKLQKSEPGK